MCRLLAICGYFESWREIVIEFQKLAKFGKKAPHQDGWGIAGSNEGNYAMSLIDKQLGSAYDSEQYYKAIFSLKKQPQIVLCHLRKASLTVPITLANAQPFVTEKWAFVHNGTIYQADTLSRDTAYIQTSDNSDTEFFFHYLLTKLSAFTTNESNLGTFTDSIVSMKNDFSSINCMLSDGEDLYVVRWCKKLPNYYTLFLYEQNGAIIISSEPLAPSILKNQWQEIPNQSVLRISGSPPGTEIITYSKI
ncbi:MAG: class II glutamine amidotransferase [Candidatus Thorarchaeota archaeon]